MDDKNTDLVKIPTDPAICYNPDCESHSYDDPKKRRTLYYYKNKITNELFIKCKVCGSSIKLNKEIRINSFFAFPTKKSETILTNNPYTYWNKLLKGDVYEFFSEINSSTCLVEYFVFLIMQGLLSAYNWIIFYSQYKYGNKSCSDFVINNYNFEVVRIFNPKQIQGDTHNSYLLSEIDKKLKKEEIKSKKPYLILFDLVPSLDFVEDNFLGKNSLNDLVGAINDRINSSNGSIKGVYLFSNRYQKNNVVKFNGFSSGLDNIDINLLQIFYFNGNGNGHIAPIYSLKFDEYIRKYLWAHAGMDMYASEKMLDGLNNLENFLKQHK